MIPELQQLLDEARTAEEDAFDSAVCALELNLTTQIDWTEANYQQQRAVRTALEKAVVAAARASQIAAQDETPAYEAAPSTALRYVLIAQSSGGHARVGFATKAEALAEMQRVVDRCKDEHGYIEIPARPGFAITLAPTRVAKSRFEPGNTSYRVIERDLETSDAEAAPITPRRTGVANPNRYSRVYVAMRENGLPGAPKIVRIAAVNAYFGWDIDSFSELSENELTRLADAIDGGVWSDNWQRAGRLTRAA